MFKKSKHTYSPRYARFTKWQGNGTSGRKRRHQTFLTDDKGDALEVSPGVYLQSRKEIHSRGGKLPFPLRFIVSLHLTRAIMSGALAVRDRLRSVKRAQKASMLGYIPLKIFIGISLITFGIYPYIWAWGNVYAFIKVCGGRVREGAIRGFAVIGCCVQLLMPFAVTATLWWLATDEPRAYELAVQASVLYAGAYLFIISPMRCFHYFDLRWNLRIAVSEWDRESMMIDRTMTSWFKLFILGSAYLQFHINRLMGLGMPGFADPEEITGDFSLGEWLRDYLRAKGHNPHAEDDYYDDIEEIEFPEEGDETKGAGKTNGDG
ncbi:MAG: hypothetical protein LBT08_00065 [Synergistaceae bacterium]|jgi:hypothetical protein|nr:hypothetical protein [Synergistaceae bacterium]